MFSRPLLLITAALLAGLAPVAPAENLRPVWETSGFSAPESVAHDPVRNMLYVSNINGTPLAKDGNGFISRVKPDGTLLEREWVTGLDAPKGLAIAGDRLYVTDIDSLVEIDIASGRVRQRYRDPTAQFMNDAAAGPDGAIYASDTAANRIYRLKDGRFEVWLESPLLDSPNGLFVEPDRIVVGCMGKTDQPPRPGMLLVVSLRDKSVSTLSAGRIGHLDGVEADGAGGYYLSDWVKGTVYHLHRGGDLETLLELGQGAADLDFRPATGQLLVPRMMDDKLAAYATGEAVDPR